MACSRMYARHTDRQTDTHTHTLVYTNKTQTHNVM